MWFITLYQESTKTYHYLSGYANVKQTVHGAGKEGNSKSNTYGFLDNNQNFKN